MLTVEEIKSYLKENLKESRYNHTLGVAECAKKLAEINGISVEKMEEIINKNNIILSDVEKNNSQLWHSIIAPIEAKDKLKIDDEEILDAVRWHTTGKENMSVLAKIIYIADMIEAGRDFPGVDEIRKATFEDLDKGVFDGLTHSIEFLLKKNLLIDINTINARNYFLLQKEL